MMIDSFVRVTSVCRDLTSWIPTLLVLKSPENRPIILLGQLLVDALESLSGNQELYSLTRNLEELVHYQSCLSVCICKFITMFVRKKKELANFSDCKDHGLIPSIRVTSPNKKPSGCLFHFPCSPCAMSNLISGAKNNKPSNLCVNIGSFTYRTLSLGYLDSLFFFQRESLKCC